LELAGGLSQAIEVDLALLHQAAVAEQELAAIDGGGDAEAGESLKGGGLAEGEALFLGGADDSRAEGMLGAPLGRGGELEEGGRGGSRLQVGRLQVGRLGG